MSQTQAHPYRDPQLLRTGPLESASSSSTSKLESSTYHTSSTSSGATYRSAYSVARKSTNDSLLENNQVEPYPRQQLTQDMPHENLQPQNQRGASEASEQIKVEPELGLYPPQGTSPGEVTSAGSSDSLVHPPKVNASSLKHFRSASSLARAPPDTPIGARSFSVPLNPSLGSQGGTSSIRSESPTSNGQDLGAYSARSHNRASKSVDLSHLYLLNVSESAHFTMTNESLSDVSHNLIKQYLGEHSHSTLLPRMKTIEMYRKNVKKSNDPKVLFQYAQYMLQTALTLDTNPSTPPEGSNNKGESLEKNMKKQFLKEAVHYLRKLSDKGYTDAQYLLGDAYSSGALGKVDNREALSLFQGAAKHGHVESAYRTAYCYEEGLGTTRDSRRAIDFLKFAASKNHPAAMYKLGMYSFYSKMGLPDNVNVKKSGIQWLTRATAKANDLTNAAPYELAKIQDAGFLDIVIPDHKYAMELYVQSASLGHVKSAAILGKAYELGDEVVQQNPDLSIHYYSQAALGGDAESMLALCAWYLVGNPPNLEKNHEEAFQWALSAANLKYPKALYTMGHFYEKGIGCAVNLETAKTWYIMAMDKGDERAKTKLQKLNSTTSVPLNEPKPLEKRDKKKKDKKGKKKDRDCVIM